MSEKYNPAGASLIPYDQIVKQDGYVTGLKRLPSPGGHGSFDIQVSGQLQSVKDYGEQAQILKLDITSIGNPQQLSRSSNAKSTPGSAPGVAG